MNLALPALVVFVLLLPGFIARSRHKQAERLSLDYSPFGAVVSEAVVWALALHLLWLGAAWLLAGRVLRPELLFLLLSSDAAAQSHALQQVAEQAGPVGGYLASLIAFAHLGPTALRALIVRFGWDRAGSPAARLFRFHEAPWYYLLSGADFAPGQRPDFIAVSAIVDVATRPMLYTGILDDYFVDRDGQLDRLILQDVMRRPLDADKPVGAGSGAVPLGESRFYRVDGDYFVLRYAEAITLNIEYIQLRPAGESAQADPGGPETMRLA
jgi:hypothetical protein